MDDNCLFYLNNEMVPYVPQHSGVQTMQATEAEMRSWYMNHFNVNGISSGDKNFFGNDGLNEFVTCNEQPSTDADEDSKNVHGGGSDPNGGGNLDRSIV